MELSKREKNIIKLEETLKIKINESVRALSLKEEEVLNLKSKISEISQKSSKETKVLESQYEKIKFELNESEETLRKLKRELDFSLINNLKQEIENLTTKNINLKKETELLFQQKDLIKANLEKTKNEFVNVLQNFEVEKKQWEIMEIEKLDKLEQAKKENLALELRKSEEYKQWNQARASFEKKTEAFEEKIENPEIRRLRNEIDSFLGSGMYTEDDPIIQELSKHIKTLSI